MKKKLIVFLSAFALAVPMALNFTSNIVKADEEAEATTVAINAKNFPDKVFREEVAKKDYDKDNKLSEKELERVTYLSFYTWSDTDEKVKSLKGIEFFTELTNLTVYGQDISALDLSKNTKLEKLSLNKCKSLKTLNLTKNTAITNLDCDECALTTLTLKGLKSLERLSCYDNKNLSKLDLSTNTALKKLNIAKCKFSTISLAKNTKLEELTAYDNVLTKLDLSKQTLLKKLDVDRNKDLTTLNIVKCTKLEELHCSNCKLTALDVSKATLLKELSCRENQLTKLVVTNCKNLTELDCRNNLLTALDISKCTKLEYLNCSENAIKALNFSAHTALQGLVCNDNKLTALNLSKCTSLKTVNADSNKVLATVTLPTKAPNLERLDFYDNKISKINLSGCTNLQGIVLGSNQLTSLTLPKSSVLETVYCYDNKLTSLNTSGATNLKSLMAGQNKLTKVDVSKNAKLERLELYSNKLTSLDVSKNTALKSLSVENNSLTKIDVSKNTALTSLYVTLNKLTSINVSKNTKLRVLDVALNNIKNLDYSKCPELVSLVKAVKGIRTNSYIQFESRTTVNGEIIFKSLAYDATTTVKPAGKVVTPTPAPTKKVTATPTPKITPSKSATVADFVERLYTVALARKSDKDGKIYWVNEIKEGRKTGGECAHFMLIEAPEFLNRGLTNAEFVETLYQTFFGRASEAAGKKYWVGELDAKRQTREGVINGFINSTEWCNICAKYGVRSGAPTAKAEIASDNAKNFATRLYTCCLNRKPEADGLKYWSLALTNLEQTGAGAAKAFFTLPEFVNQKTSNEEFVKRVYKTFMGRDADTAGLKYWVGELKAGKSRLSVLSGFSTSKEFTNICAQYGIERGSI